MKNEAYSLRTVCAFWEEWARRNIFSNPEIVN